MKVFKRGDFDWIAHWFTLGDRTGERSDIIFGRVCDDATELFRLPHIRYDGITGLLHLLREVGQLRPENLPSLPVRKPPRRWVRLREALKLVLQGPVKARKWILRNPAWQSGVSSTETFAFSWHALTATATATAIGRARALGVSLNSYLFETLCDAIEPYLHAASLPSVWTMPVSIHTELSVDTLPQNRSSYVDVRIARAATAADIDQQVRRLERNHAFWGTWLILNLGRWLGEWVVELIVKTNPKTQQKTGVFSNLGNWTAPGAPPDPASWFFMPPVMAFQPFAASALTWNGRLTLGVRLHPVLSTDKAFSQALVDGWEARLSEPAARAARSS